jgi:hypothetical protein
VPLTVEEYVPFHATVPCTAIFAGKLQVFAVLFNHGALETTGDPLKLMHE